MRSRNPRLSVLSVALAGVACGLTGCPGATGPATWPDPTVTLRVEPLQMAGPDAWMRFTWFAENADEIMEMNFGNPNCPNIYEYGSDSTDISGEVIAYISLQKRDATVAHFTIKVRNSTTGKEAETTTLIPVGAAANTAPHVVIETPSSVGIGPGEETTAEPVVFDAEPRSYDEQDGKNLSSRWDFDGDGEWDTDWIAGLSTEHSYSRAEAARGELQQNDNPDYTEYKMVVNVELRDSAGLTSAKVTTLTVTLQD